MPALPTAAATPPLPSPGPLTTFFWDGVAEHRLLILQCQRCGHHVHYPRPICDRCQSMDLAPAQVSGRGALYSYTVVMQAFHPYYIDRIPYVLAVVELDEEPGLRITTNIVQCPEEDLKVGLLVEVVFTEVAEGVTLPLFRPS
jgi:uncharacterized OB-fold protein